MHEVKIPHEVVARIRARRGEVHLYDQLAAERSALLVVDMQNNFVAPGMPSEVAAARAIVPNINRLAGAMREAGGTVVWIQMTFSAQSGDDWSVFFDGFYTPDIKEAVLASLAEDGPGHALWPELEVVEGDWRVRKDRFSAFIQGASELEQRLRRAAIDTLVVVGTLTNVCCDSTARDAMMRNFKVIMVGDANAAHSDADHNASLAAFLQVFGDVMTSDEVIARLRPAPGLAAKELAAAS